MISLFGSNVGKEELGSVGDSFDKQWLGAGAKANAFEAAIGEKIGAPFVFLNSGSNALHLAIKLLDLPKGTEVVVPSFTWIACANAVLLNGLKPVFCDVDPLTGNITAETLAPAITPNTSAVMVVHYAGLSVDMDAIRAVTKLPIIEDAAHAIDSTYKGTHCGTLGDVGIFSFDAVKNLTTGEGGGVITKNTEWVEQAKRLRYCGIGKSGYQASEQAGSGGFKRWWEYSITDSFPKMLNTDIGGAIGLEQLKKLPAFQARRRELWDRYQDRFQEDWAKDWIETLPRSAGEDRHSYFSFLIKLKSGSRDELAHFLLERKVYTSLRFHPLHLNQIYGSEAKLPNCEWLNEVGLNIPFHHRLSDGEVDTIFEALREFRQKHL